MTTEERLENLERQLAEAKRRNRRLLAAVGLAVGVFALVWIVVVQEFADAAAPTGAQAQGGGIQAAVCARAFMLVNEKGEPRAALSVTKGRPGLILFNENGTFGADLILTERGPGLNLYDENGKSRVGLAAQKGGSALVLADADGKIRAGLNVDKDGPVLRLLDEKGENRAALGAVKSGPALELRDEKGENRAALVVTKDGPGLTLGDEKGMTRAGLGAGRTTTPDGKTTIYPESSLRLFGPDGKAIWQAP